MMFLLPLLAEAATAKAECCQVMKYAQCCTFWALATGVSSLLLLVPGGANSPRLRLLGGLLALVSGVLFACDAPLLEAPAANTVFLLLAALTLGSGVAMIATRDPVYSALWFAASLVGTAGIFLMQGAQFLGVATIVVYAGAIVVTFLFVIMLAQPAGHSAYDRMSWSPLTKPLAIFSAALILGAVLGVTHVWIPRSNTKADDVVKAGLVAKSQSTELQAGGVMDKQHTALLGRELFSRQLIAVEVAGTLLMAALVGAVAIAIHGKQRVGNTTAPEGVVS
jgi:NADH-quinone oxidoreductase subunit J